MSGPLPLRRPLRDHLALLPGEHVPITRVGTAPARSPALLPPSSTCRSSMSGPARCRRAITAPPVPSTGAEGACRVDLRRRAAAAALRDATSIVHRRKYLRSVRFLLTCLWTISRPEQPGIAFRRRGIVLALAAIVSRRARDSIHSRPRSARTTRTRAMKTSGVEAMHNLAWSVS